MVQICLRRMRSTIPMPKLGTRGASGYDVALYIPSRVEELGPGEARIFKTGLEVENIPEGYEIQVRPRSGSFVKGLNVLWGTVDSDYRGELRIAVRNSSDHTILIMDGIKMAQLVIAPVLTAEFVEGTGDKTDTERGAGGFGSTDDNLNREIL